MPKSTNKKKNIVNEILDIYVGILLVIRYYIIKIFVVSNRLIKQEYKRSTKQLVNAKRLFAVLHTNHIVPFYIKNTSYIKTRYKNVLSKIKKNSFSTTSFSNLLKKRISTLRNLLFKSSRIYRSRYFTNQKISNFVDFAKNGSIQISFSKISEYYFKTKKVLIAATNKTKNISTKVIVIIKVWSAKLRRLQVTKPNISFLKIKLFNKRNAKHGKSSQSSQLSFRPFFALKVVLFNVVIFLFALAGLIFYYEILFTLPNPDNIKIYRPKQTTYIYDTNEVLLYKTYQDENRTLVTLDEVPQDLKNALIAVEDSHFREHHGISPFGMVRAAYTNYLNNEITQGASTITQQLIKNTLLTSERTWERKIKEIILALLIDNKYSKDEILTMYLNTVPFGSTSYGVQEASLMYFNKPVRDLDLAESSMLAGLPVAPTTYSPYVDMEAAKQRQKLVLIQMVKDNYIDLDKALAAYEENLDIFYPKSTINYPHFVYYVTDYLESKYGTNLVNHGGLKVYTSIDPKVQEMAQSYVTNEVSNLARLKVSNGAALVTKNKTGEIVAMVGSKDYRATDIDGYVNVTTALRQPGSSVKPFNYSLSFENGYTPATIIKDEPVVYKTPGSEPYVPKNYDNKFHGNVTVRRALANSFNIPAVKTLEKNGVENFINYVRKFGISTWNNDYYGLSLALGAAEVKMTEMNQAYSVFANNGNLVKISPIKYIEMPNGDILYYNPCLEDKSFLIGKRVISVIPDCGDEIISPQNAFLIKSILTDFNARSEAFGTNSILNVKGTGVKTGTTNDLKDNWAFGFNEEYTVGTWVGNNDGARMSYVASGITGASPIWAKIISEITTEDNYINMEKPENIKELRICSITGQLSCDACRNYTEYFISGTEPKNRCNNDYIKEYYEKRSGDKKDDD